MKKVIFILALFISAGTAKGQDMGETYYKFSYSKMTYIHYLDNHGKVTDSYYEADTSIVDSTTLNIKNVVFLSRKKGDHIYVIENGIKQRYEVKYSAQARGYPYTKWTDIWEYWTGTIKAISFAVKGSTDGMYLLFKYSRNKQDKLVIAICALLPEPDSDLRYQTNAPTETETLEWLNTHKNAIAYTKLAGIDYFYYKLDFKDEYLGIGRTKSDGVFHTYNWKEIVEITEDDIIFNSIKIRYNNEQRSQLWLYIENNSDRQNYLEILRRMAILHGAKLK